MPTGDKYMVTVVKNGATTNYGPYDTAAAANSGGVSRTRDYNGGGTFTVETLRPITADLH